MYKIISIFFVLFGLFSYSYGVSEEPAQELLLSYVENKRFDGKNFDKDYIQYLLKNGADVMANDSEVLGRTGSNGAMQRYLVSLGEPRGYLEILLKYLVSLGEDPKAKMQELLLRYARSSRFDGKNFDKGYIQYLLKNGADVMANNSEVLGKVGSNGALLKYLVSLGEHTETKMQELLLSYVGSRRNFGRNFDRDYIQCLLEQGANVDAENHEAIRKAINNEELLKKLLEHSSLDADFVMKLRGAMRGGDVSVFEKLLAEGMDLSDRWIIRWILRSNKDDIIRWAFRNIPSMKDMMLVGVSNQYGDWSSNVVYFLEKELKGYEGAELVLITKSLSADEVIMSSLNGYMNPGSGDSYPRHGNAFKLEDMTESAMKDGNEQMYQNMLNAAFKYQMPYLGVCAGAQNFVLNRSGSVQHMKEGYTQPLVVTFVPKTVAHFYGLNGAGKLRVLNECASEAFRLDGPRVAHSFAGVPEDMGEGIVLGATSGEGVPEAYTFGLSKIGFQFHPEDAYKNADEAGSLDVKEGVANQVEMVKTFVRMVAGHFKMREYGKKQGISVEEMADLIAEFEDRVVERIEECEKGDDMGHLYWGAQMGSYGVTQADAGVLEMFPDLTPEDLAYTRDGSDLIVYNKEDNESKFTVYDFFDSEEGQDLSFVSGSNRIENEDLESDEVSYELFNGSIEAF